MKTNAIFLFLAGLLLLLGCRKKPDEYNPTAANPEAIRQAERRLTDIIIHDIFSPPVASRIYAYSSLAAYEAMLSGSTQHRSLAGQLNGFSAGPQPESGREYCYPLASVRAFLTVGRAMTFSADRLDEFEVKFYKQYQEAGVPSDVFERSMAYGEAVGKHVLAYSGKDNYKQTRGFKYTVTNENGQWVPTPPAYMDAVEPLWRNIRPFTLDSAAQFVPMRPPAFNPDKTSAFQKELVQVYETVKNLTEEQREIANFWDCNPFKMNVQGHAMFATKKMSPGGHWMRIASLTTRAKKADFYQTIEAYTLTSLALFDGFIACWDEKYRSCRVRPESVINATLDRDWQPILQTPPFPEYPSGHSVISSSASLALTKLFGENFAFADSSEVSYGLPVRKFPSFKAAAQEAAISRLYGGIHYASAIDEGADQGRKVGAWVLSQVHTRKIEAPKTVAAK
ncbi:MAG: vanadium-dependent haloperoxidase [Sphingobacteriaceae bacterium]|nr:vanadium-dependent haloperoxidase [Cytophagaceae bacterium]